MPILDSEGVGLTSTLKPILYWLAFAVLLVSHHQNRATSAHFHRTS